MGNTLKEALDELQNLCVQNQRMEWITPASSSSRARFEPVIHSAVLIDIINHIREKYKEK